jgi:biotin transport system substrate-specific component
MSSVRTLTLVDVAWPRASALQQLAMITIASLFTAAAAQIAIPVPWSPVPITGQTFAVLLSGALLGPRRAFAAQLLYLMEGSTGLPLFAGGAGGAAVLAGPTGGYLLAFPFAAALTGWLCARGWDRHVSTMLAAMLIGSAVIFASGLAVLSRFVPASGLLGAGLWPFIPGDLIKAVGAAIAFPAAWKLIHPRGGSGA